MGGHGLEGAVEQEGTQEAPGERRIDKESPDDVAGWEDGITTVGGFSRELIVR